MELTNDQTGATERISQLFMADGKQRHPVDRLQAGDIGCTLKLKNTQANQTLNGKGVSDGIETIRLPVPKVRIAVEASNKQDDEKLGDVLAELHAEDPPLEVEHNTELKQEVGRESRRERGGKYG